MAGGVSSPGQSVSGRVLSILAVFEKSLAPRSLTEISDENLRQALGRLGAAIRHP